MKTLSFLRTILIISGFSLIQGCQKEEAIVSPAQELSITTTSQRQMSKVPVTRGYRDSFAIHLFLVPDIPGGWTPAHPNAPAWFHGYGNGNATHMGNVSTYFNTYTLRNAADTVMVYHAPVTQFYATQLQQFNVPLAVSAVSYDDKGNSVWFKIAPEGLTSWNADGTHITMEGTLFIVGGTGKFEGATGETFFKAIFNQRNLHDASMWQKGWIRY